MCYQRLRKEHGLHQRHEPRLLRQTAEDQPPVPRIVAHRERNGGQKKRYERLKADAVQKYGEAKVCIKCDNFKVAGCPSGLCSTCYSVQARREESPIQNESIYWRELKNL